MLIYNDFTTTT